MENSWYLCNTRTQAQFSELSLAQLIEQLKPVQKTAMTEWMVWSEGWDDWRTIESVEEIKSQLPQFKKPAPPPIPVGKQGPPPPPFKAAVEVEEVTVAVATSVTESTAVAATEIATKSSPAHGKKADKGLELKAPKMNSKAGPEQRKFPRFTLKLRVLIRSDQITFRTFTRNLSAGGAALEHDVPADLLGTDCKMYISDPETQANIRFNVKLVPNRSEARYFEFTDVASEDGAKFSEWLSRYQASHASKTA